MRLRIISKLWKVKLNDYTQVSSHLKVAYRQIRICWQVSESTAKTPVQVNVGRTWLIILHHISNKSGKADYQSTFRLYGAMKVRSLFLQIKYRCNSSNVFSKEFEWVWVKWSLMNSLNIYICPNGVRCTLRETVQFCLRAIEINKRCLAIQP